MTNTTRRFNFSGTVWRYDGPAAWHFVTLGAGPSERIRKFIRGASAPWGSVRVQAEIRGVTWETSIFPDRKLGSYLLPLKQQIRKRLALYEDCNVRGSVKVVREADLLDL